MNNENYTNDELEQKVSELSEYIKKFCEAVDCTIKVEITTVSCGGMNSAYTISKTNGMHSYSNIPCATGVY